MMIDLKTFCAGETEPRDYIREPFSRGEYTYATDGRILIRIPRRPDVTSDGGKLKMDNLLHAVEPRWASASFNPIPKPTLIPQDALECGECDGSGECECSCGHEHACGSCNGEGEFAQPMIARFPDQDFDSRYVELIRALPGAVIEFGKDDKTIAVFSFDGGVGALMPMLTRDIQASSAEAA